MKVEDLLFDCDRRGICAKWTRNGTTAEREDKDTATPLLLFSLSFTLKFLHKCIENQNALYF